MKKSLSSSLTFLYKFLFPIVWIGGFATMVGVSMWLRAPAGIDWSLSFFTIAGATFLYWGVMRLKSVEIDEHKLYISNYFRHIEVDRSNIDRVTECVLLNTHPVWIHFKNPTDFGMKVMFMPKTRFFSFFSSHPVVTELRSFAARQAD